MKRMNRCKCALVFYWYHGELKQKRISIRDGRRIYIASRRQGTASPDPGTMMQYNTWAHTILKEQCHIMTSASLLQKARRYLLEPEISKGSRK